MFGNLGLQPSVCNWIFKFQTGRPQEVTSGSRTSSSPILNTGAPQGCVLSPLLYSLFTYDCVAKHSSNIIKMFPDDTTILGLIMNEKAYIEDNNLSLNISKTKRNGTWIQETRGGGWTRPYISDDEVERVSSASVCTSPKISPEYFTQTP